MKTSLLGTGYVGFATGIYLAETGDDILYKNIRKVEKMRQVVLPIYEPHLDTLFERNIITNRLKFSTSLEERVKPGVIIKLTGINQKIIYKELPFDAHLQRQPDIYLAKKLLRWTPKIDRAEVAQKTLDYLKGFSPEELNKSENKHFSKHIKS
jgi:hypothetical protein